MLLVIRLPLGGSESDQSLCSGALSDLRDRSISIWWCSAYCVENEAVSCGFVV